MADLEHWNQLRSRLTQLIWQANDDHERQGTAGLHRHLTAYRAILHEAREYDYDVDELERFALAYARTFAGE